MADKLDTEPLLSAPQSFNNLSPGPPTWRTGQQPNPEQEVVCNNTPTFKDNFNSTLAKKLGIIQIVCGVMTMLLHMGGICIQQAAAKNSIQFRERGYYWEETDAYKTGAGISFNIFFSLAGGFALCAADSKARCKIIAQLVFAIFASIFAAILIAIAAWAIGQDVTRVFDGFYYDNPQHDTWWTHDNYASWAAKMGFGGLIISVLLMIMAIIEFMTGVLSCTVCCRVLCCNTAQVRRPNVSCSTNALSTPNLLVIGRDGQIIPGARVFEVQTPSNQTQGIENSTQISNSQTPSIDNNYILVSTPQVRNIDHQIQNVQGHAGQV